MPPITASFGSSCLLSFDLVGRPRSSLPGPPYTSRDLYIFTTSTTFSFPTSTAVNYIVVGGGGGGGTGYGGGGGGGGFSIGSYTQPASPRSVNIIVGGGGGPDANGSNSGFWYPGPFGSLPSVWSVGGGRGGGTDVVQVAASGGSGGGGYGGQNPVLGFAGAGTPGQGNAGGTGYFYGGGGGGANTAGAHASANNIKIVKATIYSSYGGGSRSANYSVQWSNNGISWTTSFGGVMSTSDCGIVDGSITSSPSLGRYPFWRYVVGSTVNGHHPRYARLYLTDEYNNTYNLDVPAGDNCSDLGTIPDSGATYNLFVTGTSTGGNGGDAFNSTITGAVVPFSGGGGGWFSGVGGNGAGSSVPSPNPRSGLQRRGGGGAGGGSGAPVGSGGSGVVIFSTPRSLGPADNTQFSFANTTTWQAPTGLTSIELLVVGGGGGGGGNHGGGGGAGGVRFTPSFPVSPAVTYTVLIGAGGVGNSTTYGYLGNTSKFYGPGVTPFNASYGGGGGTRESNAQGGNEGAPGGSGGGGGGWNDLVNAGGAGNVGGYSPSEGNNGGSSGGFYFGAAGGGGGGAGGVGQSVPSPAAPGQPAGPSGDYKGGTGGPGVTLLLHKVGGGGGGGEWTSNPAGPGAPLGFGSGAGGYGAVAATNGGQGQGGGGGGGGDGISGGAQGGHGGSGLVVIRYAGSYPYIPYFPADLESGNYGGIF
jgi:hypothetical protein